MLNFPDNPNKDDTFGSWIFDGEKWIPAAPAAGGISDSDHDGILYGRKDGNWASVDAAIGTAVAALPPPPKEVAIAFVIPGKPPINQPYFAHVVFPFTIAASTTESKAFGGQPSTAAHTMQLYKHPGSINFGSVSFAAGNQNATVTTNAISFAPGDTLQLQTAGTQDATLAEVGITILAHRT